jgi:hypothetical protein
MLIKCVLFLVVSFAAISNINAKTITIERNGKLDDIYFDKIEESHLYPLLGKSKHKLVGYNEGNIKLEWMHPPLVIGQTTTYKSSDFIKLIDDIIRNMVLHSNNLFYKGKFFIDGIKVHFYVNKKNLSSWYSKITIKDME